MKTYIGVDLGGTNVRVALVDEKGHILQETITPSYAQEGPEIVLDHIVDLIKAIDQYETAESIGIGFPGPINTKGGFPSLSSNMKGFSKYPVRDYLESRLNLKVYLDNDCNVAGLAEALLGAGRDYDIVYYITHSTGIGGALIINGKTLAGRKGYAGEVANIIIDRNREPINHLNVGAVENEASGLALIRKGKEAFGEGIASAYDVFVLAQSGDKKAIKIIDDMAYDFAQMCSVIAHVVDPDVFVIGGGVSKSSAYYLDKVIKNYQAMVHPEMRDVAFRLAMLDEPGVIGAAMLGYEKESLS